MLLPDVEALDRALPPGVRLIGLDPGARTVGVALSDVTRTIASPYGALARGRLAALASALKAMASREGAGGLVVGLPLSMDGTVGAAAQGVRDWASALSEACGLPAALWDERLSTAAVNRMLIGEADLSRRRRAAVVDRAAAAWLLQAALDLLAARRGAG
ncbi:MAG: Holliday junction resolvase RuvX [Acetobacteraceae bacterium]